MPFVTAFPPRILEALHHLHERRSLLVTAVGGSSRGVHQNSALEEVRRTALDVLCSVELARRVELVCWSPEKEVYQARNADGSIRFSRKTSGSRRPSFGVDEISGRNPLEDQDPTLFSSKDHELAHPTPDKRHNSYPYAFEHIAQVFDHPCAPDICVLHPSTFRSEAHRGEHGSLDVIQARAPFLISGCGIRRLGLIDGHCRLVDVAPTILSLLGTPQRSARTHGTSSLGAYLERQDGDVIPGLIDGDAERPERVIAFLLDGTNANMLYDMAASGDAPCIARLIEHGTALRHGAFASLPTVTLPNHTTLLTGCHPGHHGVLHNAWYDRGLGCQVVTESPATWQEAMRWLAPGVETVHEALHRSHPGTCTISVNEPADRGADYSTFDLFRSGRKDELAAQPGLVPTHSAESQRFAEASDSYHWGTIVDASAVAQAAAILRGNFAGTDYAAPSFMWVNTSLTDAASHEAGPHSEMARSAVREGDARIAEVLAVAEESVGLERTAVIVVADHGMELNDPDDTSGWGDALRKTGIVFRDEASGFLYLGVKPDHVGV